MSRDLLTFSWNFQTGWNVIFAFVTSFSLRPYGEFSWKVLKALSQKSGQSTWLCVQIQIRISNLHEFVSSPRFQFWGSVNCSEQAKHLAVCSEHLKLEHLLFFARLRAAPPIVHRAQFHHGSPPSNLPVRRRRRRRAHLGTGSNRRPPTFCFTTAVVDRARRGSARATPSCRRGRGVPHSPFYPAGRRHHRRPRLEPSRSLGRNWTGEICGRLRSSAGGRTPATRMPRRRRARLPFFLRRPGPRPGPVSEQFGRETAAAKRPVSQSPWSRASSTWAAAFT